MEVELTNREFRRYQKHIALPEIGKEGQQKIKTAKVLVIGVGGIGAPLLQYLCAMGIGTIGIVEHDLVSEDNLQRQILYGDKDVGKLKTIISKQNLENKNSFVDLKVINLKFNKQNAFKIIEDYEIIIDATDNFSTRYLINDTCIAKKKILVYGSVYKYEGQVSVFNYKNGPSLRCLYPEIPQNKQIVNPDGVGITGVLSGMAGVIMANEVIKIITGYGEVLSGKLLIFDCRNYSQYITCITKNPANFELRDIEGVDY
ncbi:ThiF family adenylyltransferase [Bacteroidota bacterium]